MQSNHFNNFLNSLHTHPLFDERYRTNDYISIDLSIYNLELSRVNVSSSIELEQFIWDYLKKNNAQIAYGGYLEKRNIYQRSPYFKTENLNEERHVHLGLDLWVEAGTPVFSPLSGQVHSFKNNTKYGDYGPTLILKHSIKNNVFYTLYGHLSLESILNLKVGVEVKKGEQIATLGVANINGDYPPHLHFQIIKDITTYRGDYPGVSNLLDLEYYKQNCPNPKLLFERDTK